MTEASMNERRRRLPRQATDGPGQYTLDGGTFAACEVLDISILGAGLELFEPPADELMGRQITVEVETPAGASITLRMTGQIRNVAAGPKGGTRVGTQFADLSETEKAILDVLAHASRLVTVGTTPLSPRVRARWPSGLSADDLPHDLRGMFRYQPRAAISRRSAAHVFHGVSISTTVGQVLTG
jgi:hypothetical protein